ncbi:hypothetical protein EB73_28865, partial [Mycobacterium sp. SWH-M3]
DILIRSDSYTTLLDATPRGEAWVMDSSERQLRHICEVCGAEASLTPGEAFTLGWDYPPRIGQFGVVGPRCCPGCPNVATAWWALVIDGYTEDMLTDGQRATLDRIAGEPDSIAVEP